MKPTVLTGPVVVAALLLSVVAAAAGSQSQNANASKWWQSEPYQRELGLTTEQINELEAIFQEALPKQKSLKKALDDAEAALERYIARQDRKAAEEQVNRVVAARSELMKSHSLMLLDMWLVLTPQQYTKLGEMQQQRSGEKPRGADKAK